MADRIPEDPIKNLEKELNQTQLGPTTNGVARVAEFLSNNNPFKKKLTQKTQEISIQPTIQPGEKPAIQTPPRELAEIIGHKEGYEAIKNIKQTEAEQVENSTKKTSERVPTHTTTVSDE